MSLYALHSEGVKRIAAERQRQIEGEGWTAEHDRQHNVGTLAGAGLCYVTWAHGQLLDYTSDSPPYDWPWDEGWWKPSDDPIRNLEKAGALIAAEIDRLLVEGDTTKIHSSMCQEGPDHPGPCHALTEGDPT